jgi:hypothetical protein
VGNDGGSDAWMKGDQKNYRDIPIT